MNVKRTKVFAKLLLLFDTDVLEVLAAEYHDASFSDQQCKLVLLRVIQVGKLEASNLSADSRSQINDVDCRFINANEVWLGSIREVTPILEFKRLSRGKRCCFIIDWKVVSISVLSFVSQCASRFMGTDILTEVCWSMSKACESLTCARAFSASSLGK